MDQSLRLHLAPSKERCGHFCTRILAAIDKQIEVQTPTRPSCSQRQFEVIQLGCRVIHHHAIEVSQAGEQCLCQCDMKLKNF